MERLRYFNRFYIDKEKDILVELYRTSNPNEIEYIIRTPNHKNGNFIKNLASVCNERVSVDNNGLKIIKGVIPCSINGDGEDVYIFRLAGMKIANIYEDTIEVKAKIPAITKTLMSQTKNYKYDIKKTIVKSYIKKESKFRTDLHTHMNANLSPDTLIAIGIAHQLRYPLYYVKKLGLKLTATQVEKIMKQRQKVFDSFDNKEGLEGKKLDRRIDDNTFINFADLILNNLKNAEENINKIRGSFALLKDGQAVFTNLEKVYVYRYVICKGKEHTNKIKISQEKVDRIPDKDIQRKVNMILEDRKSSKYKNNSLKQDLYLWIAREYQRQNVDYVEITDTDLTKVGEPAIKLLEEVHEIMPKIEMDTGVKIRLLVAIRRIPLNVYGANSANNNYDEALCVLKTVAKSPYVVGSDFIGEEINDITELKPVINEIVQFVLKEDEDFTVRIHAGENDCLRDNVAKALKCVEDSLLPGQKVPKVRIGHGLYTADLNSEDGKNLMRELKKTNAVLEFQLTSNVRLNNLTDLNNHPIRQYLDFGVKCVQGTDGCGFYGTDTFDEQLALSNLLGLTDKEFAKMRAVEDEIVDNAETYFKNKMRKFKKFLKGRSIREALFELESYYLTHERPNLDMNDGKLDSAYEFQDIVVKLPEDKIPIIIAGGSFNGGERETVIDENGIKAIKQLVDELDEQKVYFVVGHKMTGYEKAVIDYAKSVNKNFEVNAIVPKEITVEDAQRLLNEKIDGVRISTEKEMAIYKSFNYEIFERRNSIVVAFDGNSPVSNLVQEAKNGKGKAKIYVNSDVQTLKEKAQSLEGYVKEFKINQNVADEIVEDYPEIKK